MSKPRVDPTFGISSVDVLILTERHPACRWREAQPGSCKERENLAGDAKGKGPSGANRKAESTDAPERGGPLRSSEEAAVMVVERRGRVIDGESGQLATGGILLSDAASRARADIQLRPWQCRGLHAARILHET